MNSFRSCSFFDLLSLFSTAFDDKTHIGSDNRMDDGEQIGNGDPIDGEAQIANASE
jgi:hypothetical protein